MSFISEVSASAPPINNISWEKREFASPDQSWLAVFHDPFEWHMGADGWRLSVLSSENKISISNSDLERLSKGKGFTCPLDYAPWSADSKFLALCSWDSGLVFFDPSSNVCHTQKLFPQIIQWSPSFNYLLVFSNGQFTILDIAGNHLSQIDWKTAEHELPHSGWMKSQNIFFVIGRSSDRAKPRITFINAENGKIVSNELLEPEKLVPYDEGEYKNVPRGGYSLVLSASTRSVGTLLDTWNDVIYDQEKGMILLSVYRPTSKVYKLDGSPVCQVEKKWVSLKMYG